MDNKCFCCKSETGQPKLIKCCICQNNYKYSCVGLTVTDVKIITTKQGLSFTCLGCNAIGKSLNEMKVVIMELKTQISELKSQGLSTSSKIDGTDFNEIVNEVVERQKRVKNVIIYGVAENENADKNIRFRHDVDSVNNVLNYLSCNTDDFEIKPLRLGKYVPNNVRPRPIRITLSDENTVHNIIRKAKQLRGSDFNHIGISPDRTHKQIELYKKVKNELDIRKANGENNLAIRYVNGTPIIKSLN